MKNKEMDRFEKLEYLLETCNPDFIKDCFFLRDLVQTMSEDEFTACYNFICRMYEIPRSYDELNEKMFVPSEDPMDDYNYVGSRDHY